MAWRKGDNTPGYPRTDKQRKFCQEYVKCQSIAEAGRRAGFSKLYCNGALVTRMRAWLPYIRELQEKKNTLIVKRHVLDQDAILAQLARACNADPADYVELVGISVREGKGSRIEYREQLKPIYALTPEQRDVIESSSIREENGRIVYALRSKETANVNYGRHLGMYDPKLINEHRHSHAHVHLDLTQKSTKELRETERALRRFLGPMADKMLGYVRPGSEPIDSKGEEVG